ncbi:hypothetical protein V5799_007009 [Amblyomma americanum]|uniref:Peptidase S1 domain-containing protein n=1 Tax=Amblyomma americanum TaxID=6943 RepID=A0AAQ4DUS1_AMBAM
MNLRALCLTTIVHAASLARGYTINITINAVDSTPRYIDSYNSAPFAYRPMLSIWRPKPPPRPYHHHRSYHRPRTPYSYNSYRPRPKTRYYYKPRYPSPPLRSIPRPYRRPYGPPAYRPPYETPPFAAKPAPHLEAAAAAHPRPAPESSPPGAAPLTHGVVETTDPAASSGGLTKFLRRPPFGRPGRTGSGADACFGGSRCTFFLHCWMAGGSLGSSCGPLLSCCITPSDAVIKPRYYGPVKNDPYCGRSGGRISRIVGGKEAEFGQFPWQAFIQVAGSRCGGTLVSRQHVVTAGHCVAKYQYNPSSIRVTLGDYVLNSDVESLPSETFGVRQIRVHPDFRFTPQADRYDVAVLVLDRPVTYRANVLPICLPPKDTQYVARVAEAAGWGALEPGSKVRPRVLQHVHVPVLPNEVCENWHRRQGINIRIHDEMLCAGYERGGKDSCQGDSGGPLMLNDYGVYYLIGIVSAGYSCAKNYQPGIYHRVSSSSDWISSNIY